MQIHGAEEARPGVEQVDEAVEAQFYQRVLNEVDEGVYFVDVERRITFWNKAAERITGYAAGEVIGSRCADGILQHVDDRGRCLCGCGCPLLEVMGSCSPKSVDVFLHHRDGHRVPVSVRASPICDRYGRVIGCVESFHDNSARQADLERIRELEEVAYIDPLTGIRRVSASSWPILITSNSSMTPTGTRWGTRFSRWRPGR